MKTAAALRLVVGNLAVFVGLVLGLLFLLSLFGDCRNMMRAAFPKRDKRADLPLFSDHEYAQRVFREQKDSIKNYIPFLEWRHTSKHGGTLNIDDEGCRLHTIGLDNAPGATTLGFFGGSTVWGTGVDDNGTLPAQFDAITSEFVVTNRGERGYTSFQNLIDLMMLINRGSPPRVVVFFEGFNDVWVHCNKAVTTRLNGHMEEARIQSALDRTGDENYLLNNIAMPIVSFLSGAGQDGGKTIVPACSNDPERAAQVAGMIVRNLEMAHSLVESYGGEFYGFLQPNAYVGQPRLEHLNLGGSYHPIQRQQFEAVYPLVRKEMETRGREWFFDLSDALDTGAPLYIDHVHVVPEGNRIMAERVKAAMAGVAH